MRLICETHLCVGDSSVWVCLSQLKFVMYERLAGAIGQFFVNDQGESRLSPAVTKLLSGGLAGVCAQTVAARTRFSAVCLTLSVCLLLELAHCNFPYSFLLTALLLSMPSFLKVCLCLLC